MLFLILLTSLLLHPPTLRLEWHLNSMHSAVFFCLKFATCSVGAILVLTDPCKQFKGQMYIRFRISRFLASVDVVKWPLLIFSSLSHFVLLLSSLHWALRSKAVVPWLHEQPFGLFSVSDSNFPSLCDFSFPALIWIFPHEFQYAMLRTWALSAFFLTEIIYDGWFIHIYQKPAYNWNLTCLTACNFYR